MINKERILSDIEGSLLQAAHMIVAKYSYGSLYF